MYPCNLLNTLNGHASESLAAQKFGSSGEFEAQTGFGEPTSIILNQHQKMIIKW